MAPDTGLIYLASHGGVFELLSIDSRDTVNVEQLAGPIADRAQDTMGFTIAGGEMFASGHPDPRESGTTPPNLGLISSTDNAATWQNVSLIGEVDFHDIAAAVDSAGEWTLYGYRSSDGAVMVSRNSGKTWVDGAALVARDLAVDPRNPETVYATTDTGLMISLDGAVTFQLVDGAPPLVLVETIPGDGPNLIGIDVKGSVWVFADESWRETGTTEGSVEAMTYSQIFDASLVVADERGISVSRDLGNTWHTVLTG